MNTQTIYNFYNYLLGEDLANIAILSPSISENNINNYFNEMATTMSDDKLNSIKSYFGFNNDKYDKELLSTSLRMLKHPSRSKYGYPILLCNLVEIANDSDVINEKTSIYDSGLQFRTANVLNRNSIKTVGDLINSDFEQVKAFKNLGNTAIKEIELFLKFNKNI